MALFNITNTNASIFYDFKTSNVNIHVDTLNLTISELQITEQEWLGNL